jgi:hypothetical protein
MAPMLLGAVCKAWRELSRSTPMLWVALALKMRPWNSAAFKLIVRDWLLRAGNIPSSLSCILSPQHDECGHPWPDKRSFQQLGPGLRLFTGKDLFSPPECLVLFADAWGHLTSFHGDCFTPTDCLILLKHAPALIRCEFQNIHTDYVTRPTVPLLHPGLEKLVLAPAHYRYDPDIDCLFILELLTLPALRALKLGVPFSYFADIDFLSFLTKAPGIQEFIDDEYDEYSEEPDQNLLPLLNAMSDLHTLNIQLPRHEIVFEILDRLRTDPTFLPHIRTLVLSGSYVEFWEDHHTESLIGALTARLEAIHGVAQLLEFTFEFFSDYTEPTDGFVTVERLRELKERGMKIHVGLPESSRLWGLGM